MRLAALIIAWLAWSVLAYITLAGPLLFLFKPPAEPGIDGGTAAMLWSEYFSGIVGIAFLVCSRRCFDGKAAGALQSWRPALTFALCRLLGTMLLGGAIALGCLTSNRVAMLPGWIAVSIGLALLVYTAHNPKGPLVAPLPAASA